MKKVTQITKNLIRKEDFLIRIGGEEFMIVIKSCEPLECKIIAEKIRSAFANEYFEKAGTVTASFGVAVSRDYETLDSLMKRTDDLMYQAKKEGRNKVVM